tara:strand:- start:34 stop:354 length:321 start_codon:yes stop_codon:yes gene_type:complete
MANYDHEAIRKAYPNVVLIEDDKGIFDSSGNAVTIVQSNVDAARVELNKLNYQYQRTNLETGYPSIGAQLDKLYHDINSGKFGSEAKNGDWFVGISSVKTKYPKPS